MKKTILALAVPALLAAGSATAGINLYDDKGVTVDLSGAAEVQYYKGVKKDAEDQIRLDDGDLKFDINVQATDSLAAVGGIGFKFEDTYDNNATVKNDELFIGLAGNFGTVTFGRQLLINDDLGNTKDIEFGGDELGFEVAQSSQAIKYVFDNGQFYAGVSASIKEDGKKGTPDATAPNGQDVNGEEVQAFDGRLGARFGDLDARVYFYNGEHTTGKDIDETGFNFEVDYVFGDWSFAASYGNRELDAKAGGKSDFDQIAISADYTMDKTTFAGGYTVIQPSTDNSDASSIYFNVTQKLHKNVKAYGEIAFLDSDVKDALDDVAYVVGMEVKF
ncbi:porin [Thaumasiovibrio subtropicus]|uniref:porin n=1 Tax=Thaumasiovibrio subtropicus TaxID=1891207 RepID=UPI000B363E3A|nr:porin [Thaumasiovibrio subtropicus]